MTGAASLRLRGITKSFFGVPAVDGVDFDVVGGEVHGLLGENGAGKSTLCSVVAGLYRPDAGQIEVDGEPVVLRSPHDASRHGIGMVYQHFRLVERFTVADNVVLGQRLGRRERRGIAGRLGELAARYGLDVDPDAEVWKLSVGERQRVEILKQLFGGARLLVLDEPTAVLAPMEADGLFAAVDQIVERGHSVVLVSHKLPEILAHTHRVTVLRSGRNAGEGITGTLDASTLAAMMFGAGRADTTRREPRHTAIDRGVLLGIDDLTVTGDHGQRSVDGVSLAVHQGEIVGVAGVAGNGQRELHEAIAGLRRADTGRVTIADRDCTHATPRARHRAGLAYVPEDRLGTGLAPGLPLEHNLALRNFDRRPQSRFGIVSAAAGRARTEQLVADFDVRGHRRGMPVSLMSGGNLQKAILARELTEPHDVLVAAAPTRGLDLAAAASVRHHLFGVRDAGGGVLLFSEDLAEVLELADTLLVMFRGRVVGSFPRSDVDADAVGLLMSGAE